MVARWPRRARAYSESQRGEIRVKRSVIHIIASCAARKAAIPSRRLCLRTVTHKRVENRAAEWLSRLAAVTATHRAIDLYRGEYWHVVRDLVDSDVSLWVAS